ncbi:D2MP protein, partial [Pseudoatta argentina]
MGSEFVFIIPSLNPDLISSRTHPYADRKRNKEICTFSFDGPGGVLAHAFYPSNVANYTAEIHVDSTESWHIYLTEKSASNKNYLLNTLTHEIGQALGLTHSSREYIHNVRICYCYQPLQVVFPRIPSAPTLTFRYINGNLYFAKKQQFYTFNEFTRTVTEAGKFNINVLNVECSRDGLLQQMQDILGRLIRSSNTH